MRGELKHAAYCLGLDQKHIAQWHDELLKSAIEAAGVFLTSCTDSNARENVRRLVGDKNICHLLGVPKSGLTLNDTDEVYEQWHYNLWGRRTSYFVSSLLSGLKRASRANSQTANNTELVRNLEIHEKLLDDDFNKRRWGHLTPQTSLTSRGDLANCLVTYLDPVLFTSLYVLKRYRADDQVLTEDAVQILWALIEEEVGKATTQGNARNDQVVDESTMWWGVLELIKYKREDFLLGTYSGWQGVVDVCTNLIRSGGGSMRWPKVEETWYESTAEIYGETRTRLLVAKNCIELVYCLPTDWLKEISNTLNPFVARQIRYVTTPKSGVLDHICLMGLGLELSSITLHPIIEPEKKDGQLYERPKNAHQVPVDTARQKFDINAEKFCVWIVNQGQFQSSDKPEIFTRAQVETLRRNQNFNVFIDAGRVWVRKNENSPVEEIFDLGPDDIRLLTILLRYKNQRPDVNVLCQKIIGQPLEHPPKLNCAIGLKLSVKVTRFKKRMEKIFSATQFDIPDKKTDSGYFCCGNISSCVIVPRSKESDFSVPV